MTRRATLLTALLAPLAIGLGPTARAQPETELTMSRDSRAEALRILALFRFEPSVLEVQEVAARHARVNPEAYERWLTDSHLAHALPRRMLGRARTTRNDDRSARTTNASTGSLSDTVSARDQLQLEVLAEWDLSRLVFNRDGILAARQVERIVNQREDILTTVNKLYFARRQLQAEAELDRTASVQIIVQLELRIESLTADLDALTGGWFSAEIARRRPERPRRAPPPVRGPPPAEGAGAPR